MMMVVSHYRASTLLDFVYLFIYIQQTNGNIDLVRYPKEIYATFTYILFHPTPQPTFIYF